jgi:hypothetical protein
MIACRSDLNGFTVDLHLGPIDKRLGGHLPVKLLRRPTQESITMVHELLLALAFLAMIAAPAIITIPEDRDKRDLL